jgi:hypothetical protein
MLAARSIHGDAPRLVTGEEMRRRAPSPLLLEIDVSERVAVGVADDEALALQSEFVYQAAARDCLPAGW